jgi:hypothetical protein
MAVAQFDVGCRKYQFVYIFTLAPIKRATGSNGCLIAVT